MKYLCALAVGLAVLFLSHGVDAASARAFVVEPTRVGDSSCQVCAWSVRITEDILGDPVLVSTMGGNIATSICVKVPEDNQSECYEFVPLFFTLLVNYFESGCHEVLPGLLCSPMCAANEAMPRLAASRLDTVAKGFECSMCESTVQAMQQALEDGDEADEIEEDARTACKELPSSFRDFCIDYVNEEGPIILQMLEKSALPEEVCASIGACVPTTAATAPPVKLVRLLSKVGKLMAPLLLPQTRLTSAFGSQDESCEFCKVAVMEVREKLEEPEFQDAMIIYAKHVCLKFGEDYADQCSELIDQYAPLVFTMLEEQLKPLQLCEMAHLCKASTILGQM